MGYMSAAINTALDACKLTQTEMARRCGLTVNQVNRAARDTVEVGYDTADAIARQLPDEHALAVLAGWLRDRLAEDFRPKLSIEPSTLSLREDPPRHDLPTDIDPQVRADLLWLAQQSLTCPAVKDALHAIRRAAGHLTPQ